MVMRERETDQGQLSSASSLLLGCFACSGLDEMARDALASSAHATAVEGPLLSFPSLIPKKHPKIKPPKSLPFPLPAPARPRDQEKITDHHVGTPHCNIVVIVHPTIEITVTPPPPSIVNPGLF